MADSVLRDKAKQFAKDMVFLCREIKSSHKEAVLVNQLLRSATSIGANLHEAQYAQSSTKTQLRSRKSSRRVSSTIKSRVHVLTEKKQSRKDSRELPMNVQREQSLLLSARK